MYIYIYIIYIYIYIIYEILLSFQIKDHWINLDLCILCWSIEGHGHTHFNNFSRFVKTYIKEYYNLRIHFSTFFHIDFIFIIFLLNYATFNLQLVVF